MSTIFAPQTHAPRRPGARSALVSARYRRVANQLRRWNEGLDSDRHASVSELTLRPYNEASFRG